MTKDFYSILGVSRQATPDQIATRFKELARDRHPDRFNGEAKKRAEKEFQDITEAFNVLRDPRRRSQLDMDLDRPGQQANDPAQVAKVFMSRGIKAYKTGNYIEAADNFNRATEADPKDHKAWHHLALTCYQEERWLTKAQESIERAIALRATHVPYVKLAARIYLKAGMTKEAQEYYNRLLNLGGSDATVRQGLEAKGAPRVAGGSRGPSAPAPPEQQKSGLFRKLR